MHLGIDIREACRPRPTGKGAWTRGFTRELLSRNLRLSLFTDTDAPEEWREPIARSGASVVRFSERGFAWHRAVARMLQPSGIQTYVSPTSYIVPSLVGSSLRCVPVVHDLVAFRPEPHDRKARLIERVTLKRAVSRAWRTCTVSEATRGDLLQRFPGLDPETVVPVFAGGGEAHEIPHHEDGRTIVCIGTLCPRKNQRRLIQAFALLPSPLRERSKLLLIGGRGWRDDDIVLLATQTAGVEWKGYLEEQAMDAVLRSATVLALPSLYEGFGLPLLTAMRYGIPILASDRGSLREIAGDGAIMVDPEQIEDIARGLERLLTDGALRERLRTESHHRRGLFSWARTVDAFMRIL